MALPRIVLDTNVLVAGLRSRRGSSFRLLSMLGTGAFRIAVSVPLVLEYEEALLAHRRATRMSSREVETAVDYICSIAERQVIFFLWRPLLRDPSDDMVLELAVAAGCHAIVTYNRRHFAGAESFDVSIIDPGEFLTKLGGQP